MAKTAIGAPVYYRENAYEKLAIYLTENKASKIFILVDSNTHKFCLNNFLPKLRTQASVEVIEMEAGETHKNMETCIQIWNALSDLEADRKSLMLNLGGGVVTDLGGFVASCFKRGIPYINIPTTLLAMVDASVGGKTGVDLGNIKNQIGVINNSKMVLIDPDYLKTLSAEEMRSGLAEILKHGLIKDQNYWNKLASLKDLTLEDLDDIIKESVDIKAEIVSLDPEEKNLRKTLNYGHTLGHAIESYFLTHPTKTRLLHGEAVAIGMILATFISSEIKSFPRDKMQQITRSILDMYGKTEFEEKDITEIIELMKYDKKNEFGKINFVLLEDIGKPLIDCLVSNEVIRKAFDFYRKA
ncbi:3-dehydroquinate synthase [Salegentibacter sp. F14]